MMQNKVQKSKSQHKKVPEVKFLSDNEIKRVQVQYRDRLSIIDNFLQYNAIQEQVKTINKKIVNSMSQSQLDIIVSILRQALATHAQSPHRIVYFRFFHLFMTRGKKMQRKIVTIIPEIFAKHFFKYLEQKNQTIVHQMRVMYLVWHGFIELSIIETIRNFVRKVCSIDLNSYVFEFEELKTIITNQKIPSFAIEKIVCANQNHKMADTSVADEEQQLKKSLMFQFSKKQIQELQKPTKREQPSLLLQYESSEGEDDDILTKGEALLDDINEKIHLTFQELMQRPKILEKYMNEIREKVMIRQIKMSFLSEYKAAKGLNISIDQAKKTLTVQSNDQKE